MRNSKRGWIYLGLWVALIVAGIVAKRRYGHADWMVFFHGPAAVFLVMAFYRLSAPFRRARIREPSWSSSSAERWNAERAGP